MKPPVETIKISSGGREHLIYAKRSLGLKQWNEILRWAFCISLGNPEKPTVLGKLDSGMDPLEWNTFSGEIGAAFAAAFQIRASQDRIPINDPNEINGYFRAHVERGLATLRNLKTLPELLQLASQIERLRSAS